MGEWKNYISRGVGRKWLVSRGRSGKWHSSVHNLWKNYVSRGGGIKIALLRRYGNGKTVFLGAGGIKIALLRRYGNGKTVFLGAGV